MIELLVKYSTEDYVPALRRHLLSQPKVLTLFSFLSLLLISVLALGFNSGPYFDTFWFIVYSLGLVLSFGGLFFYALPYQKFRRSYKPIDEYRLEINGREIIYDSEYEGGALSWRHCTRVYEGPRYYSFEYDRERIMVIPKEAFADREEERSFREIVKQRLPPALSKKLRKRRDLEFANEYAPPKRMPDWR